MSKAVFLDRDGTINIDKNYIYKMEDFEFIPGAVEALRLLQKEGYKLIIITNQSGIARGYYTEEQYETLNQWMLRELEAAGVYIDGVYYCPHHPGAKVKEYRKECNCRKPGLGLFEDAIREHNIDLSLSYAVGDKLRDVAICQSTTCRGYLVGNKENLEVIKQVKANNVNNVKYSKNLLECAEDILSGERSVL